MSDAIRTVSAYFGPKLVTVGARRISFAEAWKEPQLRKRAVHAAQRALRDKQQEIGKGPSPESDELVMITNLLLDLPMAEGGIG